MWITGVGELRSAECDLDAGRSVVRELMRDHVLRSGYLLELLERATVKVRAVSDDLEARLRAMGAV